MTLREYPRYSPSSNSVMMNNHSVPSTSRQIDNIARIPRFSDYTRNPFINFARSYHRAGLRASESIKQAANDWRQLSSDEKEYYQRQAQAAPYRMRTRNRTFNRILRLLDSTNDEAEEDDSNNGEGNKAIKIAKMIERWKVQSYRDALVASTLPPGTVRTKRKPDPQMYT